MDRSQKHLFSRMLFLAFLNMPVLVCFAQEATLIGAARNNQHDVVSELYHQEQILMQGKATVRRLFIGPLIGIMRRSRKLS